jgi:hypothetical protein
VKGDRKACCRPHLRTEARVFTISVNADIFTISVNHSDGAWMEVQFATPLGDVMNSTGAVRVNSLSTSPATCGSCSSLLRILRPQRRMADSNGRALQR